MFEWKSIFEMIEPCEKLPGELQGLILERTKSLEEDKVGKGERGTRNRNYRRAVRGFQWGRIRTQVTHPADGLPLKRL
jgi:hypothetical protein